MAGAGEVDLGHWAGVSQLGLEYAAGYLVPPLCLAQATFLPLPVAIDHGAPGYLGKAGAGLWLE